MYTIFAVSPKTQSCLLSDLQQCNIIQIFMVMLFYYIHKLYL